MNDVSHGQWILIGQFLALPLVSFDRKMMQNYHIVGVFVCVCRFLRTFIQLPDTVHLPYLIGVVSFMDVLCEREEFTPTAPGQIYYL